ncbi:hypothetical protein [Microvirga alba]|uniref:Uncharacterized protein n=1 Tax=Microvirga alba TaxID=2791025 RepID=A0A931FLT6_9HYPH|nr:hypothetical protein [Microvirga alba]MBF9231785.1 hypothetical protein [Microvirga alba]
MAQNSIINFDDGTHLKQSLQVMKHSMLGIDAIHNGLKKTVIYQWVSRNFCLCASWGVPSKTVETPHGTLKAVPTASDRNKD